MTPATPSRSLAIRTETTEAGAKLCTMTVLALRLGAVSFGVAVPLGLVATGLQQWQVLPLLFEAETFERRLSESAEGERSEPWAPEDGAERTGYTILSNLAITWAFTLSLHAALLVRNKAASARAGMGIGAAGWVTFILSPCAGLSPELPGMAGAELIQRQRWWVGAVAASAIGIAVAMGGAHAVRAAGLPAAGRVAHAVRLGAIWILGAMLLLTPHIVGAPHPHEGHGGHRSLSSAALAVGARRALADAGAAAGPPLGMAAEFSVAVLLTTAVYWVLLGASTTVVFTWAMDYPQEPARNQDGCVNGLALGPPASMSTPLDVEEVRPADGV